MMRIQTKWLSDREWRRFTLAIGVWMSALAGFGADRPNVVIILADDQGWGDVGFNGNVDVSTPNLDVLAASGARLF